MCKIRLGIWQYLLGDLRCIHISMNNQFLYKTNMPANLENSAVAAGLEKVNCHSSPKEGSAKNVQPPR